MSEMKTEPPKRAVWLLQNICPGDQEALGGDLIERFREGKTRSWFWKQVLIAFAFAGLVQLRARWPIFCYAIAGTILPEIFWQNGHAARLWLDWRGLPWPWSQLVMELLGTAILALAALPVLAVGLKWTGAFRWRGLLLTGVVNLGFITIGHFSWDLCPWLLRPVPDHPYLKHLIIPDGFEMLLFFCTFLVAGWVGSRGVGARPRVAIN